MFVHAKKMDAIVVCGGGLGPGEVGMSAVTRQRMDLGIEAWEYGIAPHIVVSGGYSYMLHTPPETREGKEMFEYGLERGVPREALWQEVRALHTAGNALYTKVDVAILNDWHDLAVVTSDWHIERTLAAFNHVFGKEYRIACIPAPGAASAKRAATEWVAGRVVREIMRDTDRGDHVTIGERMHRLTPGYGDTKRIGLGARCIAGVVRDVVAR